MATVGVYRGDVPQGYRTTHDYEDDDDDYQDGVEAELTESTVVSDSQNGASIDGGMAEPPYLPPPNSELTGTNRFYDTAAAAANSGAADQNRSGGSNTSGSYQVRHHSSSPSSAQQQDRNSGSVDSSRKYQSGIPNPPPATGPAAAYTHRPSSGGRVPPAGAGGYPNVSYDTTATSIYNNNNNNNTSSGSVGGSYISTSAAAAGFPLRFPVRETEATLLAEQTAVEEAMELVFTTLRRIMILNCLGGFGPGGGNSGNGDESGRDEEGEGAVGGAAAPPRPYDVSAAQEAERQRQRQEALSEELVALLESQEEMLAHRTRGYVNSANLVALRLTNEKHFSLALQTLLRSSALVERDAGRNFRYTPLAEEVAAVAAEVGGGGGPGLLPVWDMLVPYFAPSQEELRLCTTAVVENNIGLYHYKLGEYALAEERIQRALATEEALAVDTVGITLFNLAQAQWAQPPQRLEALATITQAEEAVERRIHTSKDSLLRLLRTQQQQRLAGAEFSGMEAVCLERMTPLLARAARAGGLASAGTPGSSVASSSDVSAAAAAEAERERVVLWLRWRDDVCLLARVKAVHASWLQLSHDYKRAAALYEQSGRWLASVPPLSKTERRTLERTRKYAAECRSLHRRHQTETDAYPTHPPPAGRDPRTVRLRVQAGPNGSRIATTALPRHIEVLDEARTTTKKASSNKKAASVKKSKRGASARLSKKNSNSGNTSALNRSGTAPAAAVAAAAGGGDSRPTSARDNDGRPNWCDDTRVPRPYDACPHTLPCGPYGSARRQVPASGRGQQTADEVGDTSATTRDALPPVYPAAAMPVSVHPYNIVRGLIERSRLGKPPAITLSALTQAGNHGDNNNNDNSNKSGGGGDEGERRPRTAAPGRYHDSTLSSSNDKDAQFPSLSDVGGGERGGVNGASTPQDFMERMVVVQTYTRDPAEPKQREGLTREEVEELVDELIRARLEAAASAAARHPSGAGNLEDNAEDEEDEEDEEGLLAGRLDRTRAAPGGGGDSDDHVFQHPHPLPSEDDAAERAEELRYAEEMERSLEDALRQRQREEEEVTRELAEEERQLRELFEFFRQHPALLVEGDDADPRLSAHHREEWYTDAHREDRRLSAHYTGEAPLRAGHGGEDEPPRLHAFYHVPVRLRAIHTEEPRLVSRHWEDPRLFAREELGPRLAACEHVDPRLTALEEVLPRLFAFDDLDPRLFACDDLDPRLFACDHLDPRLFACEDTLPRLFAQHCEEPTLHAAEEFLPALLAYEEAAATALPPPLRDFDAPVFAYEVEQAPSPPPPSPPPSEAEEFYQQPGSPPPSVRDEGDEEEEEKEAPLPADAEARQRQLALQAFAHPDTGVVVPYHPATRELYRQLPRDPSRPPYNLALPRTVSAVRDDAGSTATAADAAKTSAAAGPQDEAAPPARMIHVLRRSDPPRADGAPHPAAVVGAPVLAVEVDGEVVMLACDMERVEAQPTLPESYEGSVAAMRDALPPLPPAPLSSSAHAATQTDESEEAQPHPQQQQHHHQQPLQRTPEKDPYYAFHSAAAAAAAAAAQTPDSTAPSWRTATDEASFHNNSSSAAEINSARALLQQHALYQQQQQQHSPTQWAATDATAEASDHPNTAVANSVATRRGRLFREAQEAAGTRGAGLPSGLVTPDGSERSTRDTSPRRVVEPHSAVESREDSPGARELRRMYNLTAADGRSWSSRGSSAGAARALLPSTRRPDSLLPRVPGAAPSSSSSILLRTAGGNGGSSDAAVAHARPSSAMPRSQLPAAAAMPRGGVAPLTDTISQQRPHVPVPSRPSLRPASAQPPHSGLYPPQSQQQTPQQPPQRPSIHAANYLRRHSHYQQLQQQQQQRQSRTSTSSDEGEGARNRYGSAYEQLGEDVYVENNYSVTHNYYREKF